MFIAAAAIFFGLVLAFSIEAVIVTAAVVFVVATLAKAAERWIWRRGVNPGPVVGEIELPTWVRPQPRIGPGHPLACFKRVPR